MLILELRCCKCGARGMASVRTPHGNLKGHQLRAMVRARGWRNVGRYDYCPVCWPVYVAEERFVREKRRPTC